MAETPRALTCPACGGTIALRAAGATITLVCEHCGTTLDMAQGDARIIARSNEAMHRPEIALGTRGVLADVQWEVVGYLERSDGEASWSEYLLFNPYEGYGFLSDDGRRFSLGRVLDRAPEGYGGWLSLNGQSYSRFGDSYVARVQFVVGEFYWRVAVGERVKVTDFVRPGTMLSCEENDKERSWTEVVMLDRGVAERAFGLPRRSGFGVEHPSPHEPSPYPRLLKQALVIAAIAVAAMFAALYAGSGHHRLLSKTVQVPFDAVERSFVLGPITLTKPYNRVTIKTIVSLSNASVDLDYALVNRRTQESFASFTTAEEYHGYDGGESWRSGNAQPELNLASIPAGTYDLAVDASAQRWGGQPSQQWGGPEANSAQQPEEPAQVIINIGSGGSFGGNMFIAWFLIAIWPLMLVGLHLAFEARRTAPLRESD